MTTLDSFFSKPAAMLHPRLRRWADERKNPDSSTSIELEVYSPESEFGRSSAEMHLRFFKDGQLADSMDVPWNDELNANLIHSLPVKAADLEQEAIRFSLGLRAGFRRVEREFGDGFFNSVLIDLIREIDLADQPRIKELLQYISVLEPHRDGLSYRTCRDMIGDAISGRAQELEKLEYQRDKAKDILIAALARYLDERFSVGSRRRMGLL
jgi:hypothetical protein